MRTRYGKECRFYYEDHLRGRETYECRLIARNPKGGSWKPSHCQNCPVPDILNANACPNLVLEAGLQKGFLGFGEKVAVFAVCTSQMCEVGQPKKGCGHCHEQRAAREAKDV